MFFELSSWALGALVFLTIVGTAVIGALVGRSLRKHAETLREPFGTLQGALLGLVGLLLAFGLSMAVSRYESRRSAVVDDANAIGTTYLRAQTLREPGRMQSLALLRRYTDTSIRLSDSVPGSRDARAAVAAGDVLQRRLWSLAGQTLARDPDASAPRLYVESLNEMIDMQTVRVAGLSNRVPGAILVLEVVGAAIALGLLALYFAIVGRGELMVLIAAGIVTLLLLVTFDLDRPARGVITVPDTALRNLRASMELPPAALPPGRP
jgi:hypothetical protein